MAVLKMILGLILLGGIPYLEKGDDIKATWSIYNTVEMTWRGERFGVPLDFKRVYELRNLFSISQEQLYNMFFEEVNHHIKEITERFFLGRSNYVVPPEGFKADQATLNEILTKSALHLMNAPDPTVNNLRKAVPDSVLKPYYDTKTYHDTLERYHKLAMNNIFGDPLDCVCVNYEGTSDEN